MNKLFYSLMGVVLFSAWAHAGDSNTFPTNKDEFIRELKIYMCKDNRPEDTRIFEAFEKQISGKQYNDLELKEIIEACNAMRSVEMPSNPYFRQYLNMTMNLKKSHSKLFSAAQKVCTGMAGACTKTEFKKYANWLGYLEAYLPDAPLNKNGSGMVWSADETDITFVLVDGHPFVSFENTTLNCQRKNACIRIEKTSGYYCPLQKKWKGKSGRVKWSGEKMSATYADLGNYQIDLKKGIYTADSARLVFPDYFGEQAIVGKLTDKIVVGGRSKVKSFPRFESYQKRLVITKLDSGMKYTGGFRLHGEKLYGFGSTTNPATIEVKNTKGGTCFVAKSKEFVIQPGQRISGEQVSTTLYAFEQDSIFHPSVNFKYSFDGKKIHLQRGERGSDRVAFFDSYHQMYITSDKIDWYLEADSMVVNEKKTREGVTGASVDFESAGYYNPQVYRRLQNVADYNPVAKLKIMSEREQSRFLDAQAFAQELNPRFDTTNIKSLLFDLLADGFIYYDANRQEIQVNDKVFHYAKAAQKQTDFDVLKFSSSSDRSNAVLDMKSKEILAHDVKVVEFSNKQKVAALPAGKQVTIKKNRNVDFDGRLFAGFSLFEGKEFHFEYDPFHIKMDSIRYLDLFLPTGEMDKNGEPVAFSIGSRIEHARGVLLIDAPNNKAGQDDISIFPSFTMKAPAYVYYDGAQVKDTTYERDSFYFRIDPLTIPSLDRLKVDDFAFGGMMITAGIFPEFDEQLRLQEEDQSLGFKTKTPDAGWKAYMDKGRYTGSLQLNNSGLRGVGNIQYLWASIDSDDILFQPKRLLSTAQSFELTEERGSQIEVPKVSGQEVSINWQPYVDSMFVHSKQNQPFQLFQEDGYTIRDLLILTPSGLKARGTFEWDKGIVDASLFSIGAFSVQSDTANVSIRVKDLDHLALNTKNVYAKLDFDQQIGTVRANADTVTTTLPFNKYHTTLNEYDWDMKNEILTFKTNKKPFGTFTSLDKKQEGLWFDGTTAKYHLKTNELSIGGVEEIITADVSVQPFEGKVDIIEGGQVDVLKNAIITADTLNRNHIITEATVTINGRRDFHAKGNYAYDIGDQKQSIHFDKIVGAPTGKRRKGPVQTIAEGQVNADDNFLIDEQTTFQGNIKMESNQAELAFSGYAQLRIPSLAGMEWFSVNCLGEKSDLKLQFDVPVNQQKDSLYAGLYLGASDAQLYPRLLMPKVHPRDRAIFSAKGLIDYQEGEQGYLLGDSLKVVSGVKQGNVMTYYLPTQKTILEGRFSIGSGLEGAKITTSGKVTSAYEELGQQTYKWMSGVELPIPEKLVKLMNNDIQSGLFDARVLDYTQDRTFYERSLSEFIPDSKALHYTVANLMQRELKIPEKFDPFSFLFAQLEMTWNADYQSFISKGDQLAIATINGNSINRWLKGYVEYKMPSNADDRIYIYVVTPQEYYYYFSIKQGVLSTVSNNEEYNEAVEGLGKKERNIKTTDGTVVEVQLAEPGTARQFVQRVKAGQ